MTTDVALSEIRREGAWALRGLGYSFGTADRATPLLVWTEAVCGKGLSLLRQGEAAIKASVTAPPPRRMRGNAREWIIMAPGKCLFEVGPPAIDLLVADFRRYGCGHVVLHGAFAQCLTAALCDLGARRGQAIVAVYRSSTVKGLPDIFGGAGWIVAAPGLPDPVIFADTPENAASAIPAVLMALGVARDEKATAALQDDIMATGNDSRVALLALACNPRRESEVAGWRHLTDYAARVRRGYSHGVVAEDADYEQLYDLERRTWAPSSERSRAQAAF